MARSDACKDLKHIKTGTFARRWQLSRAGLRYGALAMTQAARELVFDADSPRARAQRQRNIDSFVAELGKLKGSVVKVGQILATYGEYMLPPEVVEALHGLVEHTPPVRWAVMETMLRKELGEERFAELDVDPEPLAAASLGQAHRAVLRATGEELCIKIQYPGVDRTIDADMNDIIRLLKLTRMLESTRNANDWLTDVRDLLHQEVDYVYEKHTLEKVHAALAADQRFVVPKVYAAYSTARVLTMSFETGLSVNAPAVQQLPQEQRNVLGRAMLDLFFVELYEWRCMQTDPNFGNYRVRINDDGTAQWVLLDFGAMRTLPEAFARRFCAMIEAAVREDREAFVADAIELGFMRADFPPAVLDEFADIGMAMVEPLRGPTDQIAAELLTGQGEYRWRESQLPKRIGKLAIKASLSKYFALPPKEFMYAIRKLVGVYAIIAALGAEFSGRQ